MVGKRSEVQIQVSTALFFKECHIDGHSLDELPMEPTWAKYWLGRLIDLVQSRFWPKGWQCLSLREKCSGCIRWPEQLKWYHWHGKLEVQCSNPGLGCIFSPKAIPGTESTKM